MHLNKCPSCNKYTFKKDCPKCNSKTESAHYKFVKIRNAPPRSAPFKKR